MHEQEWRASIPGYQQNGNLDRRLPTASVTDILYAVKAAGHSQCGGHATSAAEAGVIVIMDQAPHLRYPLVWGFWCQARYRASSSFSILFAASDFRYDTKFMSLRSNGTATLD